MKTVLYIPTSYTENGRPSPWLQKRLDAAIHYADEHSKDECIFLPSGRWPNSWECPPITEAEVCKRYILEKLPAAEIIKEDMCVETAGGFAFCKFIIDVLTPGKIVIFNSKVNGERTKFLAKKIFGVKHNCEFVLLDDELSRNPKAIDKEPRALIMYQNLLKDVSDGDALAALSILLYKTPFYFKGLIDAERFFDDNWPGGFGNKQATEDSKKGR